MMVVGEVIYFIHLRLGALRIGGEGGNFYK